MKRRLLALPLAAWEREGLKSALVKAGLPADDVGDPHQLFWRFESHEDVPVGFGGLEVHGDEALLHSVVTLPPLRELGMGAAIVAALESRNAFIACVHNHAAGALVVFLICERCGAVGEASSADVTATLTSAARAVGFTPKSPVLELTGVCTHCGTA